MQAFDDLKYVKIDTLLLPMWEAKLLQVTSQLLVLCSAPKDFHVSSQTDT